MAIPDYESLMLPILKACEDKREHSQEEAVKIIAEKMSLSEDDLDELLPSGIARKMACRVAWAVFCMEKAGLLDKPQKDTIRITENGLGVLDQHLWSISMQVLEHYPQFANFVAETMGAAVTATEDEASHEYRADEMDVPEAVVGARATAYNKKRDVELAGAASRCLRMLAGGTLNDVVGIFVNEEHAKKLPFDPFAQLRDVYRGRDALTMRDIERWVEEGLIEHYSAEAQDRKVESQMRQIHFRKKLQEAQTMKADRERKQMAALMAEEKAEEHGSEHQAKSIADRKQDK